MQWTRRRFLALIGAGLAAPVAADAFLIEPERITITEHALGTPAPGGGTTRIVQLSDLHLGRLGGHAQRIAEETNRLAPDLIVITGDSLERADRLGVLGDFLDLLHDATPKYAILGNWEYRSMVSLEGLAKVYAARNCRLLVNETAVHSLRASRLLVTGLDDLMAGSPNLGGALSGVTAGDQHLLLVHCPGYRDRLPAAFARGRDGDDSHEHHIDCILSGHTHGGQITFFGAAPITPRGSGAYVGGWYREGGPPMYVSRGLGTTAIPARLGAPPEIAVFDWGLA